MPSPRNAQDRTKLHTCTHFSEVWRLFLLSFMYSFNKQISQALLWIRHWLCWMGEDNDRIIYVHCIVINTAVRYTKYIRSSKTVFNFFPPEIWTFIFEGNKFNEKGKMYNISTEIKIIGLWIHRIRNNTYFYISKDNVIGEMLNRPTLWVSKAWVIDKSGNNSDYI